MSCVDCILTVELTYAKMHQHIEFHCQVLNAICMIIILENKSGVLLMSFGAGKAIQKQDSVQVERFLQQMEKSQETPEVTCQI